VSGWKSLFLFGLVTLEKAVDQSIQAISLPAICWRGTIEKIVLKEENGSPYYLVEFKVAWRDKPPQEELEENRKFAQKIGMGLVVIPKPFRED